MFLTRILPFLIIVLTVVSIGFFIAASGDFIHLYEIDQGKWDVVISSSFQGSLFWAIPLAAILVTALWLLSSLLVKKMVGRKFSEVLSEDALSYLPLILGLLIPLRYLPDIAAFSSGLFSCAAL